MRTLALFLLMFPSFLFSQKEKGVTPIVSENVKQFSGQTWAVIIGISDYQEEAISDLRFADRDAEAFAQFLQSPSGGSLQADHLRLLVNSAATAGKVGNALDWLLEVCKEGDQAIVYFSGHGDVERKIIGQPGFLLCWDAPSRVYWAGGVVPIDMFQSYVSTLSLVNKTKVLVISDACHAGKLAGQNIGGAQSTTANLAKQFANEIKILSCQPNEYSLEGEQWGGGRGVFSYHLVDGLYGLADKNSDAWVTLSEIDRYLEEHVTPEAAPQSQIPMVIGNKAERLASVDPGSLARMQQDKSQKITLFTPIGGKGLEEEVLATVDSSIREIYYAFKLALKEKRYFEPAGNCAEDFYAVLSKEPKLEPLHGLMKRNYAAELQDDAQQVIKHILLRPYEELNTWFSAEKIRREYGPYPRMLERAATLLGQDHYLYSVLMARKAFFEGAILCLQKVYFKDITVGEKAIAKFRESLAFDPTAPHTKLLMGWSNFFNLQQTDSAYYYIDQAIEESPLWALPRAAKARFLMEQRRMKESKVVIDSMLSISPEDLFGIGQLGMWYFYQGKFQEHLNLLDSAIIHNKGISSTVYHDMQIEKILPLGFLGRKQEALEIFNRSIEYDSLSGFPYYFMGNMYYFTRSYDTTVQYLTIALKKDPSMIWAYSLMGDALILLKRYEEAETVLSEGLLRDSTYMPLVNALGGVYQATNRLDDAIIKFKRAIQLDGSFMAPYFNLSTVYARQQRYEEALQYLDLAIQKGMRDFNRIQRDSAFVTLREMPDYKALMKKHFPDKVVD